MSILNPTQDDPTYRPHYRMVAIDLDGTLLDEAGEISPANAEAVRQAQAAGFLVVPCTGRGWRESAYAFNNDLARDLFETGIFVTGGMVSDVATGQCLNAAAFENDLAHALIEVLADEPEAVLVYRDFNQTGHDYLVTGRGELASNTQWWFQMTQAKVHEDRSPKKESLNHSVRVGLITSPMSCEKLTTRLEREFGNAVESHAFQAVQADDEKDALHILEIFPAGVTKWRGIAWLAEQHGIRPEEIVCIGDQINDVPMMREAGLPIAMGNAIDEVKAIAKHEVATNEASGVAEAIGLVMKNLATDAH